MSAPETRIANGQAVAGATHDLPVGESSAASEPLKRLIDRVLGWVRLEGRHPLVIFAYTRVTYVLMSGFGLKMVPYLFYHPDRRQKFLEPYPFIDGLCRWDCGWFVTLVKEGYSTPENAKIFPLFPLIGWAVEKATGIHHLIVFLVVSNLASLVSYILIFRLFKKLDGEEVARCALLLFAAYPFAFYQAAAYAESLMILFTVLALTLAIEGRHIWAGISLGLAMMTRHVGIFYGPGLVAAQVKQRGFHPKKLLLNFGILGLLAPWPFLGAFMWHLKERLGDPLAFWNVREIGWGPMVWYSAREIMKNIEFWDRPELYLMIYIGLVVLGGSIALAFKKRWIELACGALPSILIFYSAGAVGLGRYSASVWPAFLPLGAWLVKRPTILGAVLVSFALIQGLMFFLFSHQWRVL